MLTTKEAIDPLLMPLFELGQFNFMEVSTGTTDPFDLFAGLDQNEEQIVLDAINSGSSLRRVIAPENDEVSATYVGFSNFNNAGPTLVVEATGETNGGTPSGFTENFNTFAGNGFAPNPAAGQLNSNIWSVTGLSDGDLSFGGTETTGDFARGTSGGGVTTGGVYAFESTPGDRLLGVQPVSSDFTPGEFVLRLQNKSDTLVAEVDVKYTIRYFNDQPRANSLNFSFSEDNVTFTPIPALDFTTPEGADTNPAWQDEERTKTIADLTIAPDDFFYLKWTGDDVSGSSSRDEYGIDDVFVSNFSAPDENGGSTDPIEAAIYEIQGNGDRSPLEGELVTTTGVVTADFRGLNPDSFAPLRGVFIQDAVGDDNPLTSDGLFLFLPAPNDFADTPLEIGDLVSVTGIVTEDSSGNSTSDGRTEFTHLDFITDLEVIGTDSIAPTDVMLPEATNGDLERYEGMLVNIASEMTVSQNFFLGRYGQMTLASPDDEGTAGRLTQPTNLFRPGDEVDALADENQRRLLILDDAQDSRKLGDNPEIVPFLGTPPPEVIRAGDKVENLVGVLDFGRINSSSSNPALDYRLQVLDTEAVTFTPQNLRQDSPDEVGGRLKVASFNVDNYFTTLRQDDSNARGAFDEVEFERQQIKILLALQEIDADIVGLVEIENNGFGSDSAIQNLVNELNNLLGAGTYVFVNSPSPSQGDGRLGTDAITNPIIYKPAKVTPIGNAAVLDKTVDERFDSDNQRPALAQTFQEIGSGENFIFVNNHFKSKGSPPRNLPPGEEPNPGDLDQGDGQGFSNFTRTQAAEALVDWLATDPTGSGDPDILITGDLNSYAFEDPIVAIEAGADGIPGTDDDFTNLIGQFLGDDAYSFVFDGQSGYLDHAIGSASIANQVTGVTEWHINADEPKVIDYENFFNPPGYFSEDPFRASDHDPLVIGLDLSSEANQPFTLQILHASDQEAGVPAFKDIPGLSAVLNALEGNYDNTLKLTSGDLYIAGPFFDGSREIYDEVTEDGAKPAGKPGIADILIQNELGWDVASVGNHEFDAGDGTFFDLLAPNPTLINGSNGGVGIGDGGYLGALFPYLANNLDYGNAELPDGLTVVDNGGAPQANSLTGSVVVDVNGESVGILGAVTPYLPSIANIGAVEMLTGNDITPTTPISEQVDALIDNLQPEIEALTDAGVNKLILMTHLQESAIEQALAQELADLGLGIDVLIGGGSHQVMANGTGVPPLRVGNADLVSGSEQDALAEYLSAFFNKENGQSPFAQEDTPQSEDERIQNLNEREDTILSVGNIIEGTPGDDFLEGTPDDDTINALAGDDTVEGNRGNDTISGDEGDDELDGGSGDDTIFGGEGDDELIGGHGDDELNGGSGNDELIGESGDDTLSGGEGDDELIGESGDDILSGNEGDDELIGGRGDDILSGDEGDDELIGGRGDDILSGDEGDDELIGGRGDDILSGGSGSDDLEHQFSNRSPPDKCRGTASLTFVTHPKPSKRRALSTEILLLNRCSRWRSW